MKIQEIMTKDPATVTPGTTVRDAAKLMQREDTGILPVVESEGNKRLVGVVTDRDITVRAVAAGKDPSSATVREAMSEGVRWVYEDASAEEAARIMSEHQIRRLPVINRDKRLVGIVAVGDFAVESSALRPAAEAMSGVSAGAERHHRH